MNKNIVVGIAVGCLIGALVASGNPAIGESVEKGKRIVHGRVKRMQSIFK